MYPIGRSRTLVGSFSIRISIVLRLRVSLSLSLRVSLGVSLRVSLRVSPRVRPVWLRASIYP